MCKAILMHVTLQGLWQADFSLMWHALAAATAVPCHVRHAHSIQSDTYGIACIILCWHGLISIWACVIFPLLLLSSAKGSWYMWVADVAVARRLTSPSCILPRTFGDEPRRKIQENVQRLLISCGVHKKCMVHRTHLSFSVCSFSVSSWTSLLSTHVLLMFQHQLLLWKSIS